MRNGICLWAILFAVVGACGKASEQSHLSLRDLTKEEVLSDFSQLSASIKHLYGPLEFKEARFEFNIDDLIAETRTALEATATNLEAIALFGKFLGRFEDGHINYRLDPRLSEAFYYKIDLFVTPVQGRALVAHIGPDLAPANNPSLGDAVIAYGDELLSIDGKSMPEILSILKVYKSFGNDVSDEHLMYLALNRPSLIEELKPTRDTAVLEFVNATGERYSRTLTWKVTRNAALNRSLPSDMTFMNLFAQVADEYNMVAQGSVLTMGAPQPFFVNALTHQVYNFSELVPDRKHLARYGISADTQLPKVFAALYQYNKKTILLVRQPDYMPEKPQLTYAYYKALLDQYEEFADVLVIDQTHNPGGSLLYVNDFFRLFISKPQVNLVMKLNADRHWISALRGLYDGISAEDETGRAFLAKANAVEAAYNAGLKMTEPMPIFGSNFLSPAKDYHWSKPILVLADELAGSCGDIFPMLMQRSGTAKIFGKRTMGLGGNVIEMPALNYSRLTYSMTRSLFSSYREGEYRDADWVENNGIEPDIPYEHTVTDFRRMYMGYVASFSNAAIALLEE